MRVKRPINKTNGSIVMCKNPREVPGSLEKMKRFLGIDRLVLQVHASSFPVNEDEDLGRGTPYGQAAEKLLAFASRLGFDAIQLGPMGLTERGNPSPYNATIFSRNPMDLPLVRLMEQDRISPNAADAVRAAAQKAEGKNRYAVAYDACKRLAAEICAGAGENSRASARRHLEANAAWLVPDALYESLCIEHSARWWGDWLRTAHGSLDQRLFDPKAGQEAASEKRLAELRGRYARTIEDYALIQMLLAEEHRSFRNRLALFKLELFGDLQIGLSPRDTWAWQRLFLEGYRMGAPPSRTNPDGQPWNYTVFDPRKFGTQHVPGPVLQFIRTWLSRMMEECDGIRVDHPHGWIDPWVYQAGDPDAYRAVRSGARLFSSPDETGHPRLRSYAIASANQIDRNELPHTDGRVRSLTESQVTRYAFLFDTIMQQASAGGSKAGNVVCEILSTLPYPIDRILKRHKLGRFRVAQKIRIDDLSDVYRIETARPEDWVTLGTHDTAGIWQLAAEWCAGAETAGWGRYLAAQLVPESRRASFSAECSASPGNLVHALFAALLASRSKYVLVFFPDLFGMTERYNRPGEINDENWMLRIPANFEKLYEERRARGKALDIRSCLATALQARAVTQRPRTL
jgi:4-alpha-glucanotransferase